jgi:Uma2 family endonuclease
MNERQVTLEKSVQPPSQHRYTYDEVVAEFPESNQPCELWDGELIVSPAPSFFHQEIVIRLAHQLRAWVSKLKLGKVVTSPIDMVLSPHRVTQPDIVFIARERLGIVGRVINGPVDLAVEIISLGNRNRDRIEKRDLYEQYGVKEYWIIDPEAQTIEVLHLEKDRYQLLMRSKPGEIAMSRLLEGFECEVNSLFKED